jgi:hypothetical protein
MFCIVVQLRVHILHCDIGACIYFVLWRWCVYTLRIVTVVCVHIMYCDSGAWIYFGMWQWYVYMFCIVTVVSKKEIWKALPCGSKVYQQFRQCAIPHIALHSLLTALYISLTSSNFTLIEESLPYKRHDSVIQSRHVNLKAFTWRIILKT